PFQSILSSAQRTRHETKTEQCVQSPDSTPSAPAKCPCGESGLVASGCRSSQDPSACSRVRPCSGPSKPSVFVVKKAANRLRQEGNEELCRFRFDGIRDIAKLPSLFRRPRA